MLVLHYTGMKDAASAIARLRDPGSQGLLPLSRLRGRPDPAHGAGGEARLACRPLLLARHQDVNSAQHRHRDRQSRPRVRLPPFPEEQIDALIPLVADIKERHGITRGNVVGHSDVAPARKQDPGELFPWHRLAKLRLALPRPTKNLMDPNWTDGGFLLALERFGYDVSDKMAASSPSSAASAPN
jgi:N-acetylmuramoyl-L-alanine amidase